MTLKVIQGHIRPPLCQNHSRRNVYGLISLKMCLNANTMNKNFSIKLYITKMYIYLKENFLDFFTLRPSDLNTMFLWITFVLAF